MPGTITASEGNGTKKDKLFPYQKMQAVIWSISLKFTLKISACVFRDNDPYQSSSSYLSDHYF